MKFKFLINFNKDPIKLNLDYRKLIKSSKMYKYFQKY